MATFTVEAVVGQRTYSTKFGDMVAYKLNGIYDRQPMQGAELSQKPTTPPPMPGQALEVTLEQTDFGPRLKKVQQQNGGGGFRGGGPEDPKRAAAILRQHSQHMALLYVANQPPDGRPKSWAEFWALVDKFDADVVRVRDAA